MEYLSELTIDSTMTIRARVYQEGYFPGPIQTNTYIINDQSEHPIIAITTNPPNLWDEHTGIYVRGPIADPNDRWDKRANWWQDWEKPAHLEYFNTDNEEWFDTDIKIKIFGGYTRSDPKKSFTILKKYFNREVFESKPQIQKFDGFILRSTRLNRPNELIYEINLKEDSKVDIQAYKHVRVYLNGKYWGLYNLMERKNDEFIEMNHGYSNIDMIEGITVSQGPWVGDISVVDGSLDNYLELLEYTNDNDLSNDENFNLIREWIDIENFIDFWIYEIFISKNDQVNIRFWRPKESTGIWRWISFDLDYLRGYEENTLQRIYNEYPAYWWWLLGSYLRNIDFRNEFINRFSDLLNTRFHQKNLMPLFLKIESSIADELEKDLIRWQDNNYNSNVYNWHYDWMIDFINERVSYVRDDILETFNIEKHVNLQLENSDTTFGKISLNSITINEPQWEGIYFKDIPVILVAVPNDSGMFIGWADSTGIISYSDSLEIALESDQYLKAMFALNTSLDPNTDIVPEAYNLHQNYPNPFNNVTLVRFDLPETTKVKLTIYNSIGQKIETVINSKMVAGKHSVLLNAKNYSSGIYYYQLLTSEFKHTKKMILLR